LGTTPYAATELVQLGESEAISGFDNHYCGIGDIDANLDDEGGNKNEGLTRTKGLKGSEFVFWAHSSMKPYDGKGMKMLFDLMVVVLKTFEFKFF